MLISQCHFDGPLSTSWVLCWAAEANGLSEAHGPPKVHGPRGHCTPLPSPLGGPACDENIDYFRAIRAGTEVYRS